MWKVIILYLNAVSSRSKNPFSTKLFLGKFVGKYGFIPSSQIRNGLGIQQKMFSTKIAED